MSRIWYPREKDIIENNKYVLENFKAKKKDKFDRFEINRAKITKAIQSSRAKKGDVEDKAIVLMRRINQLHPFGAGNRRTAHFTLNQMLLCNDKRMVANRINKIDIIQKDIRKRCIRDKEIRKRYGI